MRKFRTAALAVAFTAALVASQGTAAFAAAGSKVKGDGTFEVNGATYSFSFNGSGSTGGFTILNLETRTFVSGKATCYSQVGDTAVISGRINKDTDPNFGGLGSLVITGVDSTAGDEIGVRDVSTPTCTAGATERITTGDIKITR
jgi:hypothetical protein